jgi:hypothetical protein
MVVEVLTQLRALDVTHLRRHPSAWVDQTIFTKAEIDTPEILVVHSEAIGLVEHCLTQSSTMEPSCSILGDRKESGVFSPIIQ